MKEPAMQDVAMQEPGVKGSPMHEDARTADHVPPTLSPEAQAHLRTLLAQRLDRAFPLPDDSAGWQSLYREWEELFRPIAQAHVEDSRIDVQTLTRGGTSCLLLTPPALRNPDTLFLYIHGGGYTLFSAPSTLTCCAPVACTSGCRVLSVDYLPAPGADWRTIQDACLAAYRGCLAEDAPSRVVLFGDSAGGALALALAMRIRDASLPPPDAVVLWYPWADIDNRGDTLHTLADADPVLRWEGQLQRCAQAYADPADWTDPHVSPVYASYTDWTLPVLIQVGTRDSFLSHAVRLYGVMVEAGVDVTLDVHEGMWHGFLGFPPALPEGEAARGRMLAWLRDRDAVG